MRLVQRSIVTVGAALSAGLRHVAPWLVGLIYACVAVLGGQIARRGAVALDSPKTYATIAVGAVVGAGLVALAYAVIDWSDQRKSPTTQEASGGRPDGIGGQDAPDETGERSRAAGPAPRGRAARWAFPARWAILLMCWAPVWLSAYPGFFAYDATDELSEVLGDRVGTHHPPLHVLLLGYGVKYLYGLTGEWNRAIAVWIGAQALLVAAVFAWILGKLARLEAPLWAVAAGLAYYALFPTVVMFALCSTKDVLFSAAVTALMVLLVDLAKGRWDARFAWLLAGVALAALSLRVNMVYAYIPFALLAVWRMRGQRRRAAVVLGAPALVALFATQVLYPLVLHYVPAPIQDKLGVPIQQLARVYNLADDVSAADRERIERWWADQRHLLRYYPPNADPPKYGVNSPAIEADQSEFWRDWLAVGLNHPAVYVNATLAGTYEGWYPGAVITGYNFPGSPTPIHGPGITDYFVFYTEKPGLMHEPSALPAVRNLYEALSRSPATSRVPVLSWLMSPASMVMLLVFACGLVARRGARGAAMRLPLAMFALIVLTVYLGPVMLVRYFLYLFFAFPLLVALLARPSTFDLRPDVRLPNGKRVSAW